jgi:hypothetical protein
MTLTAVKEERIARARDKKYVAEPVEVMAFCPGCKAFQTVWLEGERLMSTRRFIQEGSQVYHNCGADQPCQLYYTW